MEIQVLTPKGETRSGVIPLDVLVGQTAFCIVSTCKLGRLGWTTSVGKSVEMKHVATGVIAKDVSVWHDTPWLLVKPYLGDEVKLEEPDFVSSLGDSSSLGILFRVDTRANGYSQASRSRAL